MTNAEYIEAINTRCSRRSYKNILLNSAAADIVKDMVDYVNKTAGLNCVYFEDASFAFTFPFSGKFAGVALCGPDTIAAREACGYYGETIVLQCTYHGLGTCWVGGTYNENKIIEKLDLPKKTRFYCLIVIGYASPKKSVVEKAMYKATHKNNKPYQKMFDVCDDKLPDYYEYAMKLVEAAPSAVNRRPVKFKYENGEISASVEEPYSDKSIDFGIAQLHFQLGASAKGVKGKWENGKFVADKQRILKFPKKNIDEQKGENNNEQD